MLATLPEDVDQIEFGLEIFGLHSEDRGGGRRATKDPESSHQSNAVSPQPLFLDAGSSNITLDGIEALARAGYEAFGASASTEQHVVAPSVDRGKPFKASTSTRRRRREDEKPDAAKTIQWMVLGSIVTFGAGLEVRGFTTGFESCTVRIKGLPTDATEREIYDLFTQQGIDEARLYLVYSKVLADGTCEVKMVMDAEAGQVLSVGLDDLDFRGSRLSFEVGTYNIPGKMGSSVVKDTNILTISCPAASIRYVLVYASEDVARSKCTELDGLVHRRRRLKAEYVQTSVSESDESTGVRRHPVKLSNLSKSTTYDHVHALAGPEAISLSPLALKGVPSTDIALEAIRDTVHSSGCRQRDILSFESPDVEDLQNGTITVRVSFRSRDAAKKVHDHIKGRKLARLGNKAFQVFLPAPLSYTITIPSDQHEAQRAQWNEMRRASHAGDKSSSCLTRLQVPGKSLIRLRVTGSDKAAVGALKLRVESLAAGEKIEGWHSEFMRPGNDFVERVHAETGAFLRVDKRQRQVRAFGSEDAIAQTRDMVEAEVARLSSRDFKMHISPSSVRAFLAQGLPELCELLGEENVRFDPSTRVLAASGGDDAHHIVSRVVKRVARGSSIIPRHSVDACPICFDAVRAPLLLPCGHAYCSSCLRHLVTSAVDSDKFPLVCLGNEAHCNAPVPIPVMEQFLPQPAFTRLLEAAFFIYVSQHPHTVKFCRTPDCEHIYRVVPPVGSRPTPVQCPACLAVVCPSCHEDEHEGLTCDESLLRSDPTRHDRLVDEWIASQDGRVKRCPQCNVPIEKTEGCNHMECRCGAHVCWSCLGIFSADDIYAHMRTVHGGIMDPVLPVAAVRNGVADVPNRRLEVEELWYDNDARQRFLGQHPFLNVADPRLMERHEYARRRQADVLDAENLRLRERFLAAEAERERRQENGGAQLERRLLTRFFRRAT